MKFHPMVAARLLLLPLVLTVGLTTSHAQEKKSSGNVPAKAKKERAKPRGRLPAYFSRVVSAIQREKIYKVQASFRGQIEKLNAQLRELEMQRDKAVEDVLTDDQKAKVAEYQAEAKRRREARNKDRATRREATRTTAKK